MIVTSPFKSSSTDATMYRKQKNKKKEPQITSNFVLLSEAKILAHRILLSQSVKVVYTHAEQSTSQLNCAKMGVKVKPP